MAHAHNSTQQSGEMYLHNYMLDKVLGVGSFGKVRIARHALTDTTVAVKILSRTKIRQMDMEEKVEREIKILKLFRHPHVIRLYEVVKTEEHIFLVMEYVCKGELFDYIVEKGRLDEDEARCFFQQMISGIEYCHRNMVVHRDLKPENLLLDGDYNVKIADFGLSNMMRDGHFLKTSCGSPNYAAPEVISGKLYSGPEVDVWSCGVILYALLCGSLPFDDENIPNLFRKIKGGIYAFPPHLSKRSRDLIGRMLAVDPITRITIQEVKKHPWFVVNLPRYLALPPRDSVSQAQVIDESLLASVVKMGFDKEETVQAIKNHTTSKSTVIYHLLHDTRKDVKKEFENAPLPQNMVDEKERNAERITISRTWTLGIQLKGQPANLMNKVVSLCHQYRIGYKKVAPYFLRCRFVKNKNIEVRLEFHLYRISAGVYFLDIQRIRGAQFTFFALCDLFRKHLEDS